MLGYFIGVVAILLAVVLAIRLFANADPKKLAAALRKIGGLSLLGGALVLAARGLFVYALPVGWIGYKLLRGGPVFSSPFPGGARKSTGQRSSVRTDYIEMRLDHDTGDMEGMVLKGQHMNRMLSDLELSELLDLLADCRRYDGQAAQLLSAYLDRVHADWREMAGEAGADDAGAAPGGGGAMSAEEAYEILGLGPGCTVAEIRKAHRALMKKMHPDQGGSTYLAAKLNEAKDLLLQRK